ncbi:MAG: outer membrane lipoprotein carrier protein LolA [Verrucomicrobia bacterium]|nr:outer membrane lipoprotein carrier protein LolA [Verrucomicrobiota bacterium]
MRKMLAVLVLCGVGAWSAQAQTGALLPYKSAHWKQTVTMTGADAASLQNIKAELWFLSPDRLRVVTVVDGKRQVILIGGGLAHVFEEGGEMGVRMPLQKQMLDKLAQFTEVFSKLDSWKKSKVGTEKVGDKTCDLYAFKDAADGQVIEGKVWLWKEKNFPVRIAQSSQGRTVTIEHSEAEINETVPPELFEPPKGVKFVEPPSAAPGAAK